jgi:hypothetical protein
MNKYQLLGGVSIFLLVLALGLAVFILTGHHSKKRVYLFAGSVLGIMLAETVICSIIYAQYHP